MARKIPQSWFDWVAALVNREPDRAKRRVEARREWNRRYPEMPVPLDRPLVAPREPLPESQMQPVDFSAADSLLHDHLDSFNASRRENIEAAADIMGLQNDLREANRHSREAVRRAEAKGAASLLLADMGIPVRKGDRR